MNTVSQAIIQWLEGFGGISVSQLITSDQLEATDPAYSLYKTPQATVRAYADGSRCITAYYRFLVAKPAQTQGQREAADQWAQAVENWIGLQNQRRNLPDLGPGHSPIAISVAGGFCMEYREGGSGVYQMSLALTYTKAREAGALQGPHEGPHANPHINP